MGRQKAFAQVYGTRMATGRDRPMCLHTGKKKATCVAFGVPVNNQLRVWSTSLFLAIQGIMARS